MVKERMISKVNDNSRNGRMQKEQQVDDMMAVEMAEEQQKMVGNK